MSSLWPDVRHALRVLRKRPLSTGAILLTFGLAIGGNVAIFSVVDGVLLSPLPFKDPDRLVGIWSKTESYARGDVAPADFRDYQHQAQSFEGIAAATAYWDVNLTGDGDPERLDTTVVSSEFFSVLGIELARGIGFEPRHDRPGSERVVILGHGLWQRRFGSDPDVVGKAITLDGEGHTVLGVMPEDLRYPDTKSDLWLPLSHLGDRLERRDQSFLFMVGRLKPGVPVAAGKAELAEIAQRLENEFPETNSGRGVTVVPLHDSLVGDLRPALVILFGAVGFVLLVACANVANLVLSQALARQREIALRAALGAGRFRSARQPLIEGLILALTGGGLGLLLAHSGLQVLLSMKSDLPSSTEIGIDGRVLVYSLLLSLATGLIVGIYPAFQASFLNLRDALKEGGRSTTGGRGGTRSRDLLLAAEIGLSLVLLIGAGLLVKSFTRLLDVDPGFDPANVVTLRVSLPDAAYPTGAERLVFFRQLLANVAALPGVEAVGATSRLPMTRGNITSSLAIDGRPLEGPLPEVGLRFISEGYFEAMRIPVLQGRLFGKADGETAQLLVIVNKTLAERFWPGESPLGQRVQMGGRPDPGDPWLSVVGVVGDVRHGGLAVEPQPEVFLDMRLRPPGGMTLVARTSSDALAMITVIRKEVTALDPVLPAYNVALMEQLLDQSVVERRFTAMLLGAFAVMALLLAAIGIYGSVAGWVVERHHEIGTRLALGAQRQQVLGLVLGRGMALTGVGLAIGLLAAFSMRKMIQSLLFKTSSGDLATFVAVPFFLVVMALLACAFPAWRASRVDPADALRFE